MDLTEKVARAMCVEHGIDADERAPNDGPRWLYYVPLSRAAIAVCAEEMAQFVRDAAKSYGELKDGAVRSGHRNDALVHASEQVAALTIASAIRSMGEKAAPVNNGDS